MLSRADVNARYIDPQTKESFQIFKDILFCKLNLNFKIDVCGIAPENGYDANKGMRGKVEFLL
jgi:hypothetical protein